MESQVKDNVRIVDLYWHGYNISSLAQSQGRMYYKINSKEVALASLDRCPVDLLIKKDSIFDLYYEIDKIPHIFNDFIVSKKRSDICMLFGITEEDDNFDILYKFAKGTEQYILSRDGFWVSDRSSQLNFPDNGNALKKDFNCSSAS